MRLAFSEEFQINLQRIVPLQACMFAIDHREQESF
jgi:hypothetical protein